MGIKGFVLLGILFCILPVANAGRTAVGEVRMQVVSAITLRPNVQTQNLQDSNFRFFDSTQPFDYQILIEKSDSNTVSKVTVLF